MIVPESELFAVLRNMNPWWDLRADPDIPGWRRAVFEELRQWLVKPPTERAN